MVVDGFVIPPNTTVCAPVGAATLPDLLSLRLPAVEVLTVQPVASPRFVGCEASVELLFKNPVGVVQVPLAVVQMSNEADCITVAVGTVKLNVYVTPVALGAELDKVTLRAVI